MIKVKRGSIFILLMIASLIKGYAQQISGKITDKETKEPLIGAVVSVEGTELRTITDIDGHFKLNGLKQSTYTLLVNYVGYKTQRFESSQLKEASDNINIVMRQDEQQLEEVTVVGIERKNTKAAMIQVAKSSPVIVSNVSAQEISLTQDTNAGEVIRRVPGVSLIDDKFVMVRGLSQRYNNVWINGGAVPSSEADSRAFSFDIIPNSQIDNLTIIKAPTSEYPADYSGGFISISTKEIPIENEFTLSVGGNWNDATIFKDFSYSKGETTDFLAFDGGLRSLHKGINTTLNGIDDNGTDLKNNHLNNDWFTKNRTPWGDLKLASSLSHRWNLSQHKLGVIAAMNYTNEYRSYTNMENNLFGIYDVQNNRSNYLRHSTDQQFNHNVRIGAMLNLTLLSRNGNHKMEIKNIFNQIGNDRYTWREGISAQANLEKSAEYYYRSRTTYNGQLTGKHTFTNDNLDWSAGYAYANRHLPDRRRYLIDDSLESDIYALSTGNDISREWTQLDEHIVSANVNNRHDFHFNSWNPYLKAGAYGEYRSRNYQTRNFIYNWNASNNNLPSGFQLMDIPTLLSNEQNYGVDKLYLLEQYQMRNNYRGHNILGAGYLTAFLPFGKVDILAGVRFEYNDMELISNTRDTEKSESSRHYKTNDLFPSVSLTYKLDEKNQIRSSYGRSINRPEFREISSSVYYDFDLASSVQGNTELKSCYVNNIDLRYEFYPSRGEMMSLAAFYKHFNTPIEWTYTVSGGTDLIYSYENAKSANNYGLELDIRKDLSFIGLQGFSWSFNGALINSHVSFDANSHQKSRPMQGQSQYLINTSLFYKNEPLKLDIALLYNRIGKRIIGVGRSEGTSDSDTNARVPDSYEMPRDVIDLTVSKKIGNHLDLKAGIRDLLAQKIYNKQFADVIYSNGSKKTIAQITRCYQPGRNFTLQVIYIF